MWIPSHYYVLFNLRLSVSSRGFSNFKLELQFYLEGEVWSVCVSNSFSGSVKFNAILINFLGFLCGQSMWEMGETPVQSVQTARSFFQEGSSTEVIYLQILHMFYIKVLVALDVSLDLEWTEPSDEHIFT